MLNCSRRVRGDIESQPHVDHHAQPSRKLQLFLRRGGGNTWARDSGSQFLTRITCQLFFTAWFDNFKPGEYRWIAAKVCDVEFVDDVSLPTAFETHGLRRNPHVDWDINRSLRRCRTRCR